MKKVILIGGTSYSGSTLLDLILGNDQNAFSCGEVGALFQPFRTHHINPDCGCGDPSCEIWKHAKKVGENNFIKYLFSSHKELETVVISNKQVPWTREQTLLLRRQGFNVINVLIYKSPVDFAYSMYKRGKVNQWERQWINYHRVYMNLVPDFIPVSYAALISDKQELQNLCDKVGVSYFPGKEEYWNKTHHLLFGNTTARYHLYPENSESFKEEQQEILAKTTYANDEIQGKFKSLYRSAPTSEFIKMFSVRNETAIEAIQKVLSDKIVTDELKYSWFQHYKIMAGYRYKKLLRKWRMVRLQKFKN